MEARVAVPFRAQQPGDMGWAVERHATLYSQEYGWGAKIEAVTAHIFADLLDGSGIETERYWIAERGLDLGRRLVEECVVFARAAGYREVVLWTHAVLLAARGIYTNLGFQLEKTWTHDDFGSPEISET